MVRAKQLGLSLFEMDELEEGMIIDMIIESGNDHCEYQQIASQEDFDRF
jgi:hypothetical protein